MFWVRKDCAQETPREVSLEGFCAHNHGLWTWTVRVFCVIWPFLRPVPWGGGQNFGPIYTARYGAIISRISCLAAFQRGISTLAPTTSTTLDDMMEPMFPHILIGRPRECP